MFTAALLSLQGGWERIQDGGQATWGRLHCGSWSGRLAAPGDYKVPRCVALVLKNSAACEKAWPIWTMLRLFGVTLKINAFILLIQKPSTKSASRYVSCQTRRLWNYFANPELDIWLSRGPLTDCQVWGIVLCNFSSFIWCVPQGSDFGPPLYL